MRYEIYLAMVATFVLVLSCNGPTKEPIQRTEVVKPEAVDSSSPKPTVEAPSGLEPYAAATLSIGNLLNAEGISWPDVDAKYEIIKPRIESIDAEHKTSYGKEIPKALADMKAGESVEVNRHIVTKGLQHVTVLTIDGLLNKLITDELENARKTSASIKTVFAAIEPTFRRRDDTIYSGKPTLAPAAERSLAQLESAQSKPAMAGAAMEFSALVLKTYVLSVLYEMKGVEEFCGTKTPNPAQCAIKRTEAGIYYRIIQPKVTSRDQEANAKIEAMLHSQHAVPEYSSARDLLASTLPFTAQDLTF